MYLTMLTHIEEGNSTLVNGLVNFHKCLLLHQIISEIQNFQTVAYNFAACKTFRQSISNQRPNVADEQETFTNAAYEEGDALDLVESESGTLLPFSFFQPSQDDNFVVVPMLISFLSELPYNSEEELWEISLNR